MVRSLAFKRLFEPGQIGQMSIRNRIVMAPMLSSYGNPEGFVTGNTRDYYEARARGGAGLIVVESTSVDLRESRIGKGQIAADDDKFVPGLTDLAQAIQRHGARAALQLQHAGGERPLTGRQPIGPSAIPRPGSGEVPRELTTGEIGDIVSLFAMAARRAHEAGFDGIELHGAHTCLVAQFLSSGWNKRHDSYGGSLANRARLLLEILHAVRTVVGQSFPVWCRINGEETGLPGAFTIREAQQVAKMLEEAGCAAVSVSAAGVKIPACRTPFEPSGWCAQLAHQVKMAVNIPVMAVGKISPELGERLLEDEKADFIVMGRALRADPDLPNKLASGHLDDINFCINCNLCTNTQRPGGQFQCTVNPCIGRETEYLITTAKKKKKVLVVGGGPAGMEAARVAALRGHKVILCERGDRLGGKLPLAAVPPYKGDINRLVSYQAAQIEKLKIETELNTEVTPELVKRYRPDVVILATGATPLIPRIEGVDRPNVVTAEDILGGKADAGKKVVILGGGMVGCEIADLLAGPGKNVTVVEMLEKVASDMGERQGRQTFLDILAAKNVILLTRIRGEQISDAGLVVVDSSGEKRLIEADTVVLACGAVPETTLHQHLDGLVAEIHAVGDCLKPRTILEAIEEGGFIARQL